MRWLLPLLCLTLSFNALASATPATSSRTVDKVLVLSPERVALYHYAHLPERFKPQRITEAVLQLDHTRSLSGVIRQVPGQVDDG